MGFIIIDILIILFCYSIIKQTLEIRKERIEKENWKTWVKFYMKKEK